MQSEYNLSELNQIAEHLISAYKDQKLICFEGDLGAGKTTLIEAICRHLGSNDELSSPTFSIINEYDTDQNPLYHMDWYRLKSIEEALNIGIEDYLYSGNYCFIEWYQHAETLIPRPYVLISLESISEEKRKIASQIIY